MQIDYEGDVQRRRIVFANGDSESLTVSPISSDHFRLEESSVLGEAHYHDVIRASVRDDGALEFLEITSRSGLRTQSWLVSNEIIESTEFRVMLDFVMSIGGNWERVFGGFLFVHVPPNLADTVEERIKALLAQPKA